MLIFQTVASHHQIEMEFSLSFHRLQPVEKMTKSSQYASFGYIAGIGVDSGTAAGVTAPPQIFGVSRSSPFRRLSPNQPYILTQD
jgi:hypothetical protein